MKQKLEAILSYINKMDPKCKDIVLSNIFNMVQDCISLLRKEKK